MYGTSEEAKAMLEKAVAAVKQDKAKALDMFNKGEGGFKDRDLYVFCANASDGIMTAHPYGYKGKQLREIFGKKGYPFGQEIMEKATEGEIKEVTYWWPRPGSDEQVKKTSFLHEGGRSNLWGWLLPGLTHRRSPLCRGHSSSRSSSKLALLLRTRVIGAVVTLPST